MKTIILRPGKQESLKRFHPWIFSGAIKDIESIKQTLTEGEIVRVVDSTDHFLALGHYQIGSITIRILSFEESLINQTFWEKRLQQAYTLRQNLGLSTKPSYNEIYRLVHGEGDQLPGLVIDIFGEVAVIQAHSVGMHYHRKEIANALSSISKGKIKHIYYKSEATLPYKAKLDRTNKFLCGNTEDSIAVENGLKFHIDWTEGQKTGFFIDQRENRRLLETYSQGKNVLNMFCYTGGFSVYAMRGAANLVHSVDASAKAIALTNRNIELNFPNDNRHTAYTEDAFKFLEQAGNNYNLIILDPPAFAKHHSALRNAIKGYTRLNAIAFSKIQSGGIIFTFSCSQAVSKEQFRLAIFTAAAQSKRHIRILHQMHQPADHPINIYHPEGEYLKGLVLYVE